VIAAVLSLQSRRTWTPSDLLAPPASEIWPGGQHLVPLGTIAQFVETESSAAADQAVVSPSMVDADTGVIRGTRRGFPGPIRTVGTDRAAGLRPGDLLVPPASRAHILLVGPEHGGFAFSGTYLALRPTGEVDGLQLWALLNSTPGQTVRQSVAVASAAPQLTVSRLLEVKVPILPAQQWARLRALVADLHYAPATTALEVGQSWWRLAALPRERSWGVYLATKNPEALEQGTALEELAVEFQHGQTISVLSDAPHHGWLPYLALRDLRAGHEPAIWAAPGSVVAHPGDIVMAEVGQRGASSVVSTPLIPGTGVCLVRLREAGLASRVVAYLNSEPGQAARALLATGSTISRLDLRALRVLRIPETALAGEAPAPDSALPVPEPLTMRLDALLWN
jgi:hypothetical protein